MIINQNILAILGHKVVKSEKKIYEKLYTKQTSTATTTEFKFLSEIPNRNTISNENFNPLQPGVAFLYPLRTLENLQKTFRFSDVFRGYRKATLGCNGLIFVRQKYL